MGFFRTQISNLEVLFYDDLSNRTGDYNRVFVRYSGKLQSTKLTAKHFSLFYNKVMFCLGKSEIAFMLWDDLNSAFKEGINKNTDFLNGDGYKLVFVSEASNYTKFSKASFYSNDTVKTKFSIGYEEFYSAMSVFAFLQYIINHSNDEDLQEFNNAIPYYIDGICD